MQTPDSDNMGYASPQGISGNNSPNKRIAHKKEQRGLAHVASKENLSMAPEYDYEGHRRKPPIVKSKKPQN